MGVEVAGRDHYQWERALDDSVARRTLFEDQNYSDLAPDSIRRVMTRTLTEIAPDAICVNGWAVPEAVAALRWARNAGARTVLMSETHESSPNLLKQTIRRWRVGQCHAAIVGGRLQARYLDNVGFGRKPVELGYDVVDNAHFETVAGQRPMWCRDEQAKPYFFANTRLLERKGIDALIRAYARYRLLAAGSSPAADSWQLIVSGSGEMEQELKALAESLGVGKSVHWPGFLQYEDLPAAYQFAGAFVHPARREPWGLVVNEAAAASLPLLVGRRVGAACELVRDGENGFLVNPDDIESFAGLLLNMAGLRDDERAAMGRRSRQLVSAFGPGRFGQALRKCLIDERRDDS